MAQPQTPFVLPSDGRRVGEWRIGRVLGEGGMGAVVEAQHMTTGALAAIKFLHPDRTREADMLTRFRREAQVCSELDDEHIVRVLGSGRAENGYEYIVMERLEGDDLAQIVARGAPIAVADAVRWVRDAARGIAVAHKRGIVHRDLKPGNLFLTHRPDGSTVVKILDFGISKLMTAAQMDASTLTTTGTMLGSPNYMAPEQLTSPREVDARCDVWALGAILYRLIAGRPPFDGETLPVVFVAILQAPHTSLMKIRADVPPALSYLVDRCLDKDPDARIPSADAVEQALGDIERGGAGVPNVGSMFEVTAPAPRASTPPRASVPSPDAVSTSSPPRRIAARWMVLGAAGAFATVCGLYAAWHAQMETKANAAPRPPPRVEVASAQPAPSASVSTPPSASALSVATASAAPSASARSAKSARPRPRPAGDELAPNERK
ncbi:MAG TPA: serine/threonine-protein kinase [Labilithrix sp.]